MAVIFPVFHLGVHRPVVQQDVDALLLALAHHGVDDVFAGAVVEAVDLGAGLALTGMSKT